VGKKEEKKTKEIDKKGIKKIITMFENNMALSQSNLAKADQIMQKCFQSNDLKEGQAAFMEKRFPKFIGE